MAPYEILPGRCQADFFGLGFLFVSDLSSFRYVFATPFIFGEKGMPGKKLEVLLSHCAGTKSDSDV
jgi:hypothetical protein